MSKGFKDSTIAKFGPFGKYNEVETVLNGTTAIYTGSNLGAAAIMVNDAATGTITLARGGDIDIAELTAGQLYEFGLFSVKATSANKIYVLKR
jgi:hypothetical protein